MIDVTDSSYDKEDDDFDPEGYKDVPDAKIERFKVAGVAPLTINEIDFDCWWAFRKEAYEEYKGDYGQLFKEMWEAYTSSGHKQDDKKVKELEEQVERNNEMMGKILAFIEKQNTEDEEGDEGNYIRAADGSKIPKPD